MTAVPDVGLWELALTQAVERAELVARPGADSTLSIADAYVISHRMLEARERQGWRRVGRKIGFTNHEMMRDYGITAPIFGYVYDRTVTHVKTQDAEISLAGLVQPKIEPEIVFHLRQPLDTRDPIEALGCVDWMALGFEIVHCHFPDWRFSAAETIADGGLHGRLLVGSPLRVTEHDAETLVDALGDFRIALNRDGDGVADGGGSYVLGSPLNALVHLAGVLRELPEHPELQAGELITTGTLTRAMPCHPGESWSLDINGLRVQRFALQFA